MTKKNWYIDLVLPLLENSPREHFFEWRIKDYSEEEDDFIRRTIAAIRGDKQYQRFARFNVPFTAWSSTVYDVMRSDWPFAQWKSVVPCVGRIELYLLADRYIRIL